MFLDYLYHSYYVLITLLAARRPKAFSQHFAILSYFKVHGFADVPSNPSVFNWTLDFRTTTGRTPQAPPPP